MRYLRLLLFFSLTCIELTRAQNFAPIGAKWHIVTYHEYLSWSNYFPYFILESTGDSVIDGRLVTIVEAYDGSNFAPDITTYFYEEDSRVFFYEDSNFKLLYNFNLNPGDTMHFQIPNDWAWYYERDPGIMYKVVVDSVNWINENGFLRKRMYTSPIYDLEEDCMDLGVVEERIGSQNALFGQECIVHAGKIPQHVRCYEDSDIQFNIYYTCDFVYGKPFAPPLAEWHYEDFSPDCLTRAYFRIQVFHDAQDNGARTIQLFEGSSGIPSASILIRHDFDQVRFYEDGQYKLLYDFGLEAGDTMSFHMPRIRHHFDFTCNDSLPLASSYQVIVDSVSFQTIDGLELKSMHTSPLGNDCIDLGIVTEKFGSSHGLFGAFCNICTTGCSGHFRCYSDEDINFMASPENCDYTTSLRSLHRGPSVNVYPNPVTSDLFIQGDLIALSRVSLVDMFGNSAILPSERRLDLSFLTSGVYMLIACDDQNQCQTLRLVKI